MENYFSTTSSSLDDVDVHGTMRKLINKTVTLLNFYKEIPVSYSAKLLDYDEDGFASLDCHPVQARLIDFDRYTIVRYGPHAFKAELMGLRNQTGISSQQQKMRFSRFLPVEVFTDQRNLVRVIYDNPLNVTLSFEGTAFSAKMIDSSATSFRIKALEELPMEPRDKANARFQLPSPEGPTLIEVEAKLVKKSSEAQVFTMDVSRLQEASIMKYINQRQVEIIKELNME